MASNNDLSNPAIHSAEKSMKTNLLGLSRSQLEAFFLTVGEKRFRAEQVMKWIYGPLTAIVYKLAVTVTR